VLSPRPLRLLADLQEDWRRFDERIEAVSARLQAAYGPAQLDRAGEKSGCCA
jgi:hypothetical protein